VRAADEIADQDASGDGDAEGGSKLAQSYSKVADELPGRDDIPELEQHRYRTGKKNRAHVPAAGREIPQRHEHDQERRLHAAAGEISLAPFGAWRHTRGSAPGAALSAMVFRISSCRSP
jgi:hypothetical protein